jgi:hypothetical protein
VCRDHFKKPKIIKKNEAFTQNRKKTTTIFETILLNITLFKMKGLRIASCLIILLTIMFISSCTKEEISLTGGSHFGIWQRYGSPNGYNTDLAVGNIPGEPSNRVYMCEHPGSPSTGLYKGYISGNIITWNAIHGLPNAEFKEVGSERTLYFGVGAVADAGKYKKGIWTNTSGDLKYTSKNIYYRWTTLSTCPFQSGYSLTYNHPDLPRSLTKNQQYGPMAAGSIEITVTSSNGSTSSYNTLSEPLTGYKRIYTHNIFRFNDSVNCCNFYLNDQSS